MTGLRFNHPSADIYVPGGGDAMAALSGISHLCIAAHPDDIEILAYHGIVSGFGQDTFGGVIVTDGGGSPRSGPYGHLSDTEMKAVRRDEQRRAAAIGQYGIQIQLGHPSDSVKDPAHLEVVGDLVTILSSTSVGTLYLHNPLDKHDTHIAVLQRCLEALRALPKSQRPRRVLGCEAWRALDWVPEARKIALDSSEKPELAAALIQAFESQISGGKRYDLALLGRRQANATFLNPHSVDACTAVDYAVDLAPLMEDDSLTLEVFATGLIEQFREDVIQRLRKF